MFEKKMEDLIPQIDEEATQAIGKMEQIKVKYTDNTDTDAHSWLYPENETAGCYVEEGNVMSMFAGFRYDSISYNC